MLLRYIVIHLCVNAKKHMVTDADGLFLLYYNIENTHLLSAAFDQALAFELVIDLASPFLARHQAAPLEDIEMVGD